MLIFSQNCFCNNFLFLYDGVDMNIGEKIVKKSMTITIN